MGMRDLFHTMRRNCRGIPQYAPPKEHAGDVEAKQAGDLEAEHVIIEEDNTTQVEAVFPTQQAQAAAETEIGPSSCLKRKNKGKKLARMLKSLTWTTTFK